MRKQDLIELFQSFDKKKIIIIGDVMIDSYLWGSVNRISPEAPIPIVVSKNKENRMGGAANVAVNIRSLGATPILCSVIGEDDQAPLFMELLKNQQMTSDGILCDETRKTTVKTRIISNNQHLLRIDEETQLPLHSELEQTFENHIYNIIEKFSPDAIIFQDYDKGVITPYIIKTITNRANQLNIPTLVDPKKRNFTEYKDATFFKPNFKEFCEGNKIEIQKNNTQAMLEHAKSFVKDMRLKYLMITLSEYGVFIACNEQNQLAENEKFYYQIPAEIRDITDVSGAGDTVISTAGLALVGGCNAWEVAVISNLAGGLVCEKIGVVPVNKNQLLEECIQYFEFEEKR